MCGVLDIKHATNRSAYKFCIYPFVCHCHWPPTLRVAGNPDRNPFDP